MKKGIFDKRIPTIVAIVFLLVTLSISILLIQSGVIYVGRASPEPLPKNLHITNITDTSFTVVYTTTDLYEGVIAINNSNTGNAIFLDDRDRSSGRKNKYYSHHITALNLTPETKYFFNIISGSNTYHDASYSITTGVSISDALPEQNPVIGRVINTDGTQASDSLIIVKSSEISTISSYTDAKGEFIIPTNSLRNINSNKYYVLENDTSLDFTILSRDNKTIITTPFKIAQSLPAIVLNQQYLLSDNEEGEQGAPPQLSVTNEISQNPLTITSPNDGETFTDLRPEFRGTSLPESKVTIEIDGEIIEEVTTNHSGIWTFRAGQDFEPGNYVIAVSSFDESQNTIFETSSFSIFPQGSQVFSEDLNPTTTPTLVPSNTPAPSPTSTPIPSPTPTITLVTPTETPTEPTPTEIVPTNTPSPLPTIPVTPTKVPPIDPPGILDNSLVITGISIGLILTGSILFLLL